MGAKKKSKAKGRKNNVRFLKLDVRLHPEGNVELHSEIHNLKAPEITEVVVRFLVTLADDLAKDGNYVDAAGLLSVTSTDLKKAFEEHIKKSGTKVLKQGLERMSDLLKRQK